MKALRLYHPGDLRVVDEPTPQPGAGEALVRVKAVGLCGSDLHWFTEGGIGDSHLVQPHVLGHEFAGEIEDGSRRGERIAVDPAISCGECRHCLDGNPNFCLHLRFAGDGKTDGGLREKVAWPERFLFPIPDSISEIEGAMLEPLGVALHSLDLSHLRMGMKVGVFGCGPIGLLVIQLARRAGADQIIAVDKLPHRMEAAMHCGATQVFSAQDAELGEQIATATHHQGIDIAFEAAGENAAVEAAIGSARRGGRVVLIGIPADDRISFSASTTRRKGLTLAVVRRMKNTYPRAVHLVESGWVDVRSLVSHRFTLDQYAEAFRVACNREGLKVIIEP
ncbi:MAG: alcohol dehydrogenase catalytic domain-containing protein [Chloroflexi bacterium]|nr:alcohol dehydrogenase catalytic domain-containing protein [Chloroflexota bacterium]